MNTKISIEQIDHRLARIKAIQEVSNLMGRYSYYHTAGMHAECAELFALNTPGVRAEMMWGVYEGEAGIRRLYPDFHEWADGDRIGIMHQHALTTPVIEVAGDGVTAKAVWVSPGHQTAYEEVNGDRKLVAKWAWMKYGVDFIIENGMWKIWHLHTYGIFLTPYDQSWIETEDDQSNMDMPASLKPDRPPTTHWMYALDRVCELVPEPPCPYHSFDERTAY